PQPKPEPESKPAPPAADAKPEPKPAPESKSVPPTASAKPDPKPVPESKPVAPAPAPEAEQAPKSDPPVAEDQPKQEELDPMKTMMITGDTRDNVKVNIPEEDTDKGEAPKVEDPKSAAPDLEVDAGPRKEKAAKTTPPPPELPKFDSPEVAPPVLESTNLDPELKEEIEKDSLATPPAKPPTTDLPKVDDSAKPEKIAPDKPSAPIPSPFDKSMPPGYAPPSTPPFDPTEPVKAEKVGSAKSAASDDWASPPAPVDKPNEKAVQSSGGSGSSGSVAEGQNNTLAIVSLVCGVLSMTLCCGTVGLILGPAGAVTGFMAKGKIKENPTEYGGGGLASGGLITGIIGTVFSIIVVILYVLRWAAILSF
ncbi:MAG: DUF4190 domain-containing protein, partial [Pyrinomonadaceae bacterium]|nr:DUF4190 domain-containing protein [Pyrinomonadaceae bacterium]